MRSRGLPLVLLLAACTSSGTTDAGSAMDATLGLDAVGADAAISDRGTLADAAPPDAVGDDAAASAPDAGAPADAGTSMDAADAAEVDAGSTADSGAADAGEANDAAPIDASDPDAAASADASEPDAAVAADASTALDASAPADAGSIPGCGGDMSDPDLLVWYRGDFAGASVQDSSSHALHVTPSGGVTGANGYCGVGLAFNQGSLDLPSASFTNLPAVTVEAWLYLESTPGPFGMALVAKTANNQDVDFGVVIDSGLRVCWLASALDTSYGYRNLRSAPSTVPLRTWVHIGATYDVATNARRVFMNGHELATPDSFGMDVAQAMSGSGPMRAGNQRWTDSGGDIAWLVGSLDEIRVWRVARTPEQVCQDAGGSFVLGACTP